MSQLESLLAEVRACRACAGVLPLGPRPLVQASATARILIASQAPGTKGHESGIPFDDASGERLRDWMGLTSEEFYDARHVAIVPMGLCYPGRLQGEAMRRRAPNARRCGAHGCSIRCPCFASPCWSEATRNAMCWDRAR